MLDFRFSAQERNGEIQTAGVTWKDLELPAGEIHISNDPCRILLRRFWRQVGVGM
jgi:hypothetical protein